MSQRGEDPYVDRRLEILLLALPRSRQPLAYWWPCRFGWNQARISSGGNLSVYFVTSAIRLVGRLRIVTKKGAPRLETPFVFFVVLPQIVALFVVVLPLSGIFVLAISVYPCALRLSNGKFCGTDLLVESMFEVMCSKTTRLKSPSVFRGDKVVLDPRSAPDFSFPPRTRRPIRLCSCLRLIPGYGDSSGTYSPENNNESVTL